MHLPFWLTVAVLSPAIIPLAVHTRRRTLRLPEASGEPSGQYGTGRVSQRLLVVGESTAAGVGVDHHREGLASQLAALLAQDGGAVRWHTLGVNGIRMAALIDTLTITPLPACDAIFISMGVNDTTGLTSRANYRKQLSTLIARLKQQQPDACLYVLAVPPMHRFTALPAPLRQVLGWRARLLDRQQRRLAEETPGVHYLGYPPLSDPALLANDGYHPSAPGYRAMAEALQQQL